MGRGVIRIAARRSRQPRSGAAAVEAAIIMPWVVLFMFGVWDVGRLIDISTTLQIAARVGARYAAGGVSSTGTPVTCTMVTTEVQNYLQAAGYSSSVATIASVTVTNLSSDTWTDPGYAIPLDPFSVKVTLSGTAFSSLTWVASPITGVTQASATVYWLSNNDQVVTVNPTLPYGQNVY